MRSMTNSDEPTGGRDTSAYTTMNAAQLMTLFFWAVALAVLWIVLSEDA